MDGNYLNRGELYLKHEHTGVDLQLDYATDTLENLQLLWNRPVHLETVVDETKAVLSYDGEEHDCDYGNTIDVTFDFADDSED